MVQSCWDAAKLLPLVACVLLTACSEAPRPGKVFDEAMQAGRAAASA